MVAPDKGAGDNTANLPKIREYLLHGAGRLDGLSRLDTHSAAALAGHALKFRFYPVGRLHWHRRL